MAYLNCPFEAPLECCTIPCYLLTYVCHLFLGYTGTFIVICTTRFTCCRPNCWSSSCSFPPAPDGCPALPAAAAGAALAAFLISRVLASGQLSDERCGLNLYVLQSSDDMQTKTAWLTITIYRARRHAHLFISIRLCELAYEKLEITPHGRVVIDAANSAAIRTAAAAAR